jgi:hypothetical protein
MILSSAGCTPCVLCASLLSGSIVIDSILFFMTAMSLSIPISKSDGGGTLLLLLLLLLDDDDDAGADAAAARAADAAAMPRPIPTTCNFEVRADIPVLNKKRNDGGGGGVVIEKLNGRKQQKMEKSKKAGALPSG